MKLLEISKPEVRVFLRWLRNPLHLLKTLTNFGSIISSQRTPKNLIDISDVTSEGSKDSLFFRYIEAIRSGGGTQLDKSDFKIFLASTDYCFRDGIDWNCVFEDAEDYSALHRFSWLNSDEEFFSSSERGHEFIRNWIETFHQNESDVAYQSYNISERLINWVFFLTRWRTNNESLEEFELQIYRSMKKQLSILANNLEQGGERYTNNHLLNNGRALYLVGWFIGDASFVEIGQKCIRYGYQSLISTKGVLNEHSSHYHLLISKNIFELFLVASEFDHDFRDELRPILRKIFEVALLFTGRVIESPFPLIGDISPDATPQSLIIFCNYISTGAIAEARQRHSEIGWFDIWDLKDFDFGNFRSNKLMENPFFDEESGFFIYQNDPFRFYFHDPVSGKRPNFSHYHADDCSFTLMYRDSAIINDPGRSSYIQSHVLSQYAKGSFSHSSVYFNGMPISPPQFKLFPPAYGEPRVNLKLLSNEDPVVLQVSHDGFRRIKRTLSFRRQFELSSTVFRLKDFWNAPVAGSIVTRFQMGVAISEIQRGENFLIFVLTKTKEEIRMNYAIDGLVEIKIYKGLLCRESEDCAGWSFSRYGAAVPSFTLDFEQEKSGVFVNKFEILNGLTR